MTTSRPALASSSAAADPAGPAPTTTTSTVITSSGMTRSLGQGRPIRPGRRSGHPEPLGQLPEHRRGVGDDAEIGHRRHRAGRVGIDAHHMLGRAEALRMLHNNLDPEVAENPDELIVYGGTGRAARDWP